MLATACGWLPSEHPSYRWATQVLLPFALALLLLGVDLPSVYRIGWRALGATLIGMMSIGLGLPLIARVMHTALPPEAWKGVGTLAATWTGGSMNLLAVNTMLGTPEEIFTALIVVDALVAYTWMACLVSLSTLRTPLDHWLRAKPLTLSTASSPRPDAHPARSTIACAFLAVALAAGAFQLAGWLPTNTLMSARNGWTVFLVTTGALVASLIPAIRMRATRAPSLGYPCLYGVLAAMGAQANFSALWTASAWVVLGVATALFHGVVMLLAGRALRLPLSMLATASQANLGGVASTPIVGAVYDPRLAPVGLLLAVGLNAVGTYLGLVAASLARWLMRLSP